MTIYKMDEITIMREINQTIIDATFGLTEAQERAFYSGLDLMLNERVCD